MAAQRGALSSRLTRLAPEDRRRCWRLLGVVIDTFVHHADARDLLEGLVMAVTEEDRKPRRARRV